MTPQQVKASICALFKVEEDDGVLAIETPLRNLGDDHIVVFASPSEDGKWRIDDNGDTAFSLSLAGYNIVNDRFDEVAQQCCMLPETLWDTEEQQFSMLVEAKDIGIASLLVATAASRLINAITSRKERKKGDFKERLMAILDEITKETSLPATFDAAVDGDLLRADCRIETPVPTYIIAATSSERLTEAELIHSRLRVAEQPGYVVAVVESVEEVGKKHYQRANYFTDKAIEYDGNMFEAFMKGRLVATAPQLQQ